MWKRPFWTARIEDAWKRRNVVWLSGIRRVGKTVLCRSLPDIEYFDCELPRTRRAMEDPQAFLDDIRGKRVVLDEIHRLDNPSQLLKIAADHYPDLKVIATGSSTLSASGKFRDTLAGRKTDLWLTPVAAAELKDFRQPNLERRLLHGGLPPFLLAEAPPERDFQEWMDAYWARDVQELFRVGRRASFQKFAELLLINSGGIFEATRYARPCDVSRPTIANYLAVLEATFVVHAVHPHSSHRSGEIISAPKVYGFDTGFVCYHRGWKPLRRDDLGILWEHLVLNEMHAHLQTRDIRYWRDKRQHEVDFVLPGRRGAPIAIECKWSADNFDAKNLRAFRHAYPKGDNFVVAQDVTRTFHRDITGMRVTFLALDTLITSLRTGK
ncbi:MAG: ATP-binding protein [Gammaproteobacteria bacterium]|nr:ATP-binding protein [Gammaproteobacteria bacterium]